MMEVIIFEITGGIGKNIAATAVIRAIKKQHSDSKLIVITAYPAVFVNNPNVHRILNFNTPHVYDDYVRDNKVIFMCLDPYKSNSHLTQAKHLSESWCEINNVGWDGARPELFLSPLEIQRARNLTKTEKPLLLFQPFGGFKNDVKYSWNRDIPPLQAQELANALSQQYTIFQIANPKQILLNKTTHYHNNNLRELFALVAISSRRLGIDSMLQHCCAALKLSATVCWVSNTPKVFGYDVHQNIFSTGSSSAVRHTLEGIYEMYDFTGSRTYDFPFDSLDVFNVGEIQKTLN